MVRLLFWLGDATIHCSSARSKPLLERARTHLHSELRRRSVAFAKKYFTCGLTFDMSGPEPDLPAERNMNLRSGAGQAGGGPLDGRVRAHVTGHRYFELAELLTCDGRSGAEATDGTAAEPGVAALAAGDSVNDLSGYAFSSTALACSKRTTTVELCLGL
jgi:hypothetical protein